MSPSANTLHLGAGGFPVALELTSQEGSDNHSPGMNPWAMIVSLFGLMLPNSVASDRFLHPACPRRSNAPGA